MSVWVSVVLRVKTSPAVVDKWSAHPTDNLVSHGQLPRGGGGVNSVKVMQILQNQ